MRQILLLALAAPGACGGKIIATTVEPDDSMDAAAGAEEPSGGGALLADASIASIAVDASGDAAIEASADAAGDGDDGPGIACTVVDAGQGGLVCQPWVLSCDAPVLGECTSTCQRYTPPSTYGSCIASEAGVEVQCWYGCAGGRRPAGFEANPCDAFGSLGRFFANLAELEAASVDAFEILRDELVAHGAPAALVGAAERAAEDEVRHAKITGALAKRYGAAPASHSIERRAIRQLDEIAIENAREGCVRETYGALVAMHQAECARDPVIRRAMRRIAEDETRHAELAWGVASWASAKLDVEARSRVNAAIEGAFEALSAETTVQPAMALRTDAGLPSAARAAQMLIALRRVTSTDVGAAIA